MSGPPAWAPHFFDLANPDQSIPLAEELPWLIERLVGDIDSEPDWRVDAPGSETIQLFKVSHSKREAQIGFTVGAMAGVLILATDPSGWLRVDVVTGAGTMFRAWLDRPYEEYELWPSGSVDRVVDPPGRMGKKRNWLSLSIDAWPHLRPIAHGGAWVNLKACAYLTVFVRLLGGGAEAWRQTRGMWSDEGLELLPPDDYDPVIETWEFPPGSIVKCEMRVIDGREETAAIARL